MYIHHQKKETLTSELSTHTNTKKIKYIGGVDGAAGAAARRHHGRVSKAAHTTTHHVSICLFLFVYLKKKKKKNTCLTRIHTHTYKKNTHAHSDDAKAVKAAGEFAEWCLTGIETEAEDEEDGMLVLGYVYIKYIYLIYYLCDILFLCDELIV